MTTTARMRQVITDLATKHSVTVQQITSARHSTKNVLAALVEISKTLHLPPYGYSLHRIGTALNRDHSTICHHIHKSAGVGQPRWRKPRIKHLNCLCRRCTLVRPLTQRQRQAVEIAARRESRKNNAARELIRYAGYEL